MEAASPTSIVRAYWDAAAARDADAMAAFWAPDGTERIAAVADAAGPEGIRAHFAALFAAIPDWTSEVLSTVTEGDRVAVHWRATGTFTGEPYQGIEATGSPIDFTGLDVFQVRDGKLVAGDAYPDSLTFARQIGLMPAAGTPADARLARAFNVRTRVTRRAIASEAERIADGLWLVRGGFPSKTMNVYLIEDDGGGVTLFDAGIRAMTNAVAAAAAALGGVNRIVLGHSHEDHRGTAPALNAPVLCHPAERAGAEAAAPPPYVDARRLGLPARWVLPRLLESWDGGPVRIAETVDERDEVSGFRVVHLPGHAPGQIALHRERDRLALVSDAFYTLDIETGFKGAPRVPHPFYTQDTEQARASVRKLAALDLAAAWPGHADPVTGDVRGQLERVAAA